MTRLPASTYARATASTSSGRVRFQRSDGTPVARPRFWNSVPQAPSVMTSPVPKSDRKSLIVLPFRMVPLPRGRGSGVGEARAARSGRSPRFVHGLQLPPDGLAGAGDVEHIAFGTQDKRMASIAHSADDARGKAADLLDRHGGVAIEGLRR